MLAWKKLCWFSIFHKIEKKYNLCKNQKTLKSTKSKSEKRNFVAKLARIRPACLIFAFFYTFLARFFGLGLAFSGEDSLSLTLAMVVSTVFDLLATEGAAAVVGGDAEADFTWPGT